MHAYVFSPNEISLLCVHKDHEYQLVINPLLLWLVFLLKILLWNVSFVVLKLFSSDMGFVVNKYSLQSGAPGNR